MSIAKFVEGFNKAIGDRIAKAEANVEAHPYPVEELKKIKDTLPDSAIAKRYGGDGVIDKSPELIAASFEQDKDLVKRLDDGEKAYDKFMAARKLKRESDPQKLITNLYSNVYSLLAQSRALGANFTMKELIELSPEKFEETYNTLLEEADATDLDLPVSVDSTLILDAFKEMHMQSADAAGKSAINEGSTEPKKEESTSSPVAEPEGKKEEPSNSPVSEPSGKKVEETSSAVQSTTSTPAELPAVESKEEAKPQTTVNVNLEQIQTESKPTEPLAPSPVNEKVETASSQGSPEKIEETKTEQTFTPVDANSIFYGGGDFSVNNKTNVSPINVAEGASSENVSSTSQNSSYLSMFGDVSSSTSVSQQPSNISSTINENSGESTSNVSTSTSENVQTTNTSNTVTSSNSYMDLVSQMMGGSTIPDVPNVPTVSSEMPSIPKSEVSFANSENVSQNKSENSGVNQPTQNNLVEQPAQTQTKTETTQDKTNQSTVSESSTNQQPNQSTTVQNNEEVVERLTRLERLLSGPLDVRLV